MESTALITQEALDALSYRSAFGKSLKQISLQKLPLDAILEDVAQYRAALYRRADRGGPCGVPLQKRRFHLAKI